MGGVDAPKGAVACATGNENPFSSEGAVTLLGLLTSCFLFAVLPWWAGAGGRPDGEERPAEALWEVRVRRADGGGRRVGGG